MWSGDEPEHRGLEGVINTHENTVNGGRNGN